MFRDHATIPPPVSRAVATSAWFWRAHDAARIAREQDAGLDDARTDLDAATTALENQRRFGGLP